MLGASHSDLPHPRALPMTVHRLSIPSPLHTADHTPVSSHKCSKSNTQHLLDSSPERSKDSSICTCPQLEPAPHPRTLPNQLLSNSALVTLWHLLTRLRQKALTACLMTLFASNSKFPLPDPLLVLPPKLVASSPAPAATCPCPPPRRLLTGPQATAMTF